MSAAFRSVRAKCRQDRSSAVGDLPGKSAGRKTNNYTSFCRRFCLRARADFIPFALSLSKGERHASTVALATLVSLSPRGRGGAARGKNTAYAAQLAYPPSPMMSANPCHHRRMPDARVQCFFLAFGLREFRVKASCSLSFAAFSATAGVGETGVGCAAQAAARAAVAVVG